MRLCCSFSDPTKADGITFGGRAACASYGCTQGEEGFDVEIGAYGLQFAFWGYLQGIAEEALNPKGTIDGLVPMYGNPPWKTSGSHFLWFEVIWIRVAHGMRYCSLLQQSPFSSRAAPRQWYLPCTPILIRTRTRSSFILHHTRANIHLHPRLTEKSRLYAIDFGVMVEVPGIDNYHGTVSDEHAVIPVVRGREMRGKACSPNG